MTSAKAKPVTVKAETPKPPRLEDFLCFAIYSANLAIDAEVVLGTAGDGYFLQARLNVSLPGLDRDVAQALVEEAHQTCPYSKLTRGNINVELNLV